MLSLIKGENDGFKQWFKEVRPGNLSVVDDARVTWIDWYDIPCQA